MTDLHRDENYFLGCPHLQCTSPGYSYVQKLSLLFCQMSLVCQKAKCWPQNWYNIWIDFYFAILTWFKNHCETHSSGTQSAVAQTRKSSKYTGRSLQLIFSSKDYKCSIIWAQCSVYLWSSGGRWWWVGVGDEEDGGDDSGGIATGTQKRGSKQGEALTSACFTFERDSGKRRKRSREQGDR